MLDSMGVPSSPTPTASFDPYPPVTASDHPSFIGMEDQEQSHAAIVSLSPADPAQRSTAYLVAVGQSYQLPSFSLPKFWGEVEAFPAFWSVFSVAVHNNITLPAPVKLLYLKTCLRGKALDLITSYPIAASYPHAVRAILAVYGCPDVLRSRLLEKLAQMPASTESIPAQFTTLSALRGLWSQLQHLNEDSGSISTLNIIQSKFSPRTRQKVDELKKAITYTLTVEVLLDVVEIALEQQSLRSTEGA
ncbi:hypothetical protein OESDEN_23191, partial [Oesophagostomum dentatum]